MGKIETIYVSGLGAIGSAYAAVIKDNSAASLKIIADKDRINRYSQDGVFVNGRKYDFSYITPDTKAHVADLIIIAVKQHHLDASIQAIKNFVGKDTIILSLLNGIVSEEVIGRVYGMEKLLYSYVVGTDAVREGTQTTYSKLGKIVFGDQTNTAYSSKVLAVKELFDGSGVPYSIPEDMLRSLWWKFMLNVGINQVSAVLKAPYGVFQNISEARELMVMASREVVALSQKTGIYLKEEDIEEYVRVINTLSPEGKTSMLQDIEAQRKTEVEIFSGTVMELGQKHSIPTPVNEMLYKLLKVLEQSQINNL